MQGRQVFMPSAMWRTLTEHINPRGDTLTDPSHFNGSQGNLWLHNNFLDLLWSSFWSSLSCLLMMPFRYYYCSQIQISPLKSIKNPGLLVFSGLIINASPVHVIPKKIYLQFFLPSGQTVQSKLNAFLILFTRFCRLHDETVCFHMSLTLNMQLHCIMNA